MAGIKVFQNVTLEHFTEVHSVIQKPKVIYPVKKMRETFLIRNMSGNLMRLFIGVWYWCKFSEIFNDKAQPNPPKYIELFQDQFSSVLFQVTSDNFMVIFQKTLTPQVIDLLRVVDLKRPKESSSLFMTWI